MNPLSPLIKYALIGLLITSVLGGLWGYIGHLQGVADKAKIALVNQERQDALDAAAAANLALQSAQMFARQLSDERAIADAEAAAREKVSQDEIEKLRTAQQAGTGVPLSPAVLQYLDRLR